MMDQTVFNGEQIGFAPLGETFTQAREAKNLTLKDVSNHLRLSVKQIESLESNDFAHLPPAAIVRGFIRNYARLLELDAEPLLASYNVRMPQEMPVVLSVQTSVNRKMDTQNNQPLAFKSYVISGFAIFMITAVGYYLSYYPQESASAAKESAAKALASKEPSPLPVQVPSLPEASSQNAESLPKVVAPTEAADVLAGTGAVAKEASLDKLNVELLAKPQVATKTEASVKTEAQAKVSEQNSLAASSLAVNVQLDQSHAASVAHSPQRSPESALVKDHNAPEVNEAKKSLVSKPTTDNAPITNAPIVKAVTGLASSALQAGTGAAKVVNVAVTEKTWVRVKDKAGKVIYEKILQPNSEATFDGVPPLKMLIDNAKATKLTYLGQLIDLSADTKNNVARVTLE